MMAHIVLSVLALALNPSPRSLQAAVQRFGARIDAEADEVLRPLIAAANVSEAKMPRLERRRLSVSARPVKKAVQRTRPKKAISRRKTFAERLDADADAALAPGLLEDITPQNNLTALQEPEIVAENGPERAAAWLMSKYAEITQR